MNSVLESSGPGALHIERLWWLTLIICTAVFVAVMLALALAVSRRRTGAAEEIASGQRTARALRWIGAGAVTTAVLLFVLLVASIVTDRRLDAVESGPALTITITAQQWWWDVRYHDSLPSQVVTTANEIHVPVGQPVQFHLQSADVIHSFWVPSLAGKRDLIPGRDNLKLWIRADRSGVYQGQCAEFCGHQHAHMRFRVVAQEPAEFEAWIRHQRTLAREPETEEQKRGKALFLSRTCMMCHAIRGTPAGSRAGPDLTHFASRATLGAGARSNTREHLAAWINDAQAIKPGAHMPSQDLPPAELDALVAYLEHLQ